MIYVYKKSVEMSFSDALEKVKQLLEEAGFGIVTNLDMSHKLKEKLDADVPPYMILGACKPSLAYKALQIEEDIGLMLPCKVAVYEEDEEVIISAALPTAMMSLADNPDLMELAASVEKDIKAVLDGM